MNLGNPSNIVVYYLQIGGMTCLGYVDGFLVVNALVFVVTHWTGSMINLDISYRVVTIQQDPIPYGLSTLTGY